MRNGWKHSIQAMALLMGCVLITACSDDTPESDNGEVLKMASCFTRSGGNGSTWQDGTTIELFVATGTTYHRRQITYSEDVDGWTSNATVKPGENYCIYGYMPRKADYTVTPAPFTSAGRYNDGASLTFSGLNPVTTDEVCYIIGVKDGTAASTEDFTEKSYSFTGKAKGENNISLLMTPLYASLKLNIKVDSRYEALRTIKLKKLCIETTDNTPRTITISQPKNYNVTVNISSTEGSSTSTSAVLFENEDGIELSSTVALEIKEGYFLADISNRDLTLVSTYDVYDKSGQKIRENCTAPNHLRTLVSWTTGTKTNIALTVNPTYLHVLSDPDLDNPDIDAKVVQTPEP